MNLIDCGLRQPTRQILRAMKISFILLTFAFLQVGASGVAQSYVTYSGTKEKLETVFKAIEKQTGFVFFYNDADLKKAAPVSVELKHTPLEEALAIVLKNQPLSFSINGKTIFIKERVLADATMRSEGASVFIPPPIEIRGRVTNEAGDALTGVSVTVEGVSKVTVITNEQGQFKLTMQGEKAEVTITYVGFAPISFLVQGKTLSLVFLKGAVQAKTENNERSTASMDQNGFISVKLARLVKEEEDVIITGIVNKHKESFTGSSVTYSQKELREAGGTNILQSLKTLDPAFAIRENVQMGSDPNRLPDLEIRGKTSLLGTRDELTIDPNQPLFILDGFESSLAIINDLDINRIESITILKDAASTAIYGSKAANGVVVVETVKPKAGKLQITYNGNTNIQMPDLSSYNLMDAAEKLEFERLSGRFDPSTVQSNYRAEVSLRLAKMYNDRLRMLAEGINTYWLAEPLRVGASQKHSLYLAGGEGNFLFGIGGGYNGITGVMKESKRNVINGNIDLIYRVSKFQFSNKWSVQTARFQNPIVTFSEFSRANPYYKKTNNGEVEQWLEYTTDAQVGNPMWNASQNSRDIGYNLQLTNFFVSEWSPTNNWRVRGRFGFTFDNNDTEKFTSPEDTRQMVREITRRGQFISTDNRANRYEADLTVNYNRLVNKHRVNLAAGSNINSNNSLLQGYSVEGFPGGDFTSPNFSRGYPLNSRPVYREALSRSLNGYFNAGYAFDDRYLMDISLRSSGSTVFGSNRRFNNTWSVGLGWNLHREQIISDIGWINFFKIRGSVGNPGNQNFSSGQTLLTYNYNSGLQSYFGLGAMPDQMGNPDLKWQVTRDKNIGLDLTVLNKKLSFIVDYFYKVTDPLLIAIDMPSSSATTRFLTNAGEQVSQGLTFSTAYQILRNTQRRILWSIRVNGRTQKNRIDGIGNKLDKFNQEGRGNNTTRYVDGADPDDIWAIKSRGIDPSTGRELFLTKDGRFTYDFSFSDEVIVGNSRPDMEGIVGSSFTFRGFTLNLSYRYTFGAEIFNTAVFRKVENVDMLNNQDRRALYERWHKPGDIRRFKNIRDENQTRISSRLVQAKKSVTLESIYAEYQFAGGWVKKAGLGNFRVFASARDLFELSTIQVERGIDYPFARVIDAGLSFNF